MAGNQLYVGRLQDSLAAIPGLRSGNALSGEFQNWQSRTRTTLGQQFGERHPYTWRFAQLDFHVLRIALGGQTPGWTADDQAAFVQDLHQAEQLLRDAIEEATSQTGADHVFHELMSDTVTLVKKSDGSRHEGVRASVQGNKLYTMDVKLPVIEGDHFERPLPNGQLERLDVEEVTFFGGGGTNLGHFKVGVRRSTSRKPQGSSAGLTVNIQGDHTRFNVNSTDQSVNVSGGQLLFSSMREAIERQVPEPDRAVLLAEVDGLEQTKGTPAYLKRYTDFMQVAANHMAVFQPFIAQLAQLLGG